MSITTKEKLLCIFVKNPFSQRDFERMGIEALRNHFNVQVFDCTSLLMPLANKTRADSSLQSHYIHTINSWRELYCQMKSYNEGLAVDYVGPFSPWAVMLFWYLKFKGLRLIVVDSGAFPPLQFTGRADAGIAKKLFSSIQAGWLREKANAALVKIAIKILPDQSPDYALISGSSWITNPRFVSAKTKLLAHSFDYETYLTVCAKPVDSPTPYVIYLDEKIADHEDNIEMGYSAPVSGETFYPALSSFFDRFEAAFGMPVVIAGYPSRQLDKGENCFGKRQVYVGNTAELIRDAHFVFAHASTSISYAILWRKPIIFLFSEELAKSWYMPVIETRRTLLNSYAINIDDRDTIFQAERLELVDIPAYEAYECSYIKMKDNPQTSLWDVFASID